VVKRAAEPNLLMVRLRRAMPANAGSYLPPNAVERIFGRILVALVRIGLVGGHFHVLEVRGRKSGRTISLPVDPIEWQGRRYLVCARGTSHWVRNVRAAGDIVLARARQRRRYAVRELPADQRAPVLKAYLDAFSREVQRFFPVPKGSPVTAFEALAPRFPVFELEPIDTDPSGAGAAARDDRP
jgi:deazaflavin-dependent oxidoreductase (nitroreductase family)